MHAHKCVLRLERVCWGRWCRQQQFTICYVTYAITQMYPLSTRRQTNQSKTHIYMRVCVQVFLYNCINLRFDITKPVLARRYNQQTNNTVAYGKLSTTSRTFTCACTDLIASPIQHFLYRHCVSVVFIQFPRS